MALNLPPMRRWVNERVVLNFTLGISKSKLEFDGSSLRLKFNSVTISKGAFC